MPSFNSGEFRCISNCNRTCIIGLIAVLKYIDIGTLELGPNSSITGRSNVTEQVYKIYFSKYQLSAQFF